MFSCRLFSVRRSEIIFDSLTLSLVPHCLQPVLRKIWRHSVFDTDTLYSRKELPWTLLKDTDAEFSQMQLQITVF